MNAKKAKALRKALDHHPSLPRNYVGDIPPVYIPLPNAGGYMKLQSGTPRELEEPSTRYYYQRAKRWIVRGLLPSMISTKVATA